MPDYEGIPAALPQPFLELLIARPAFAAVSRKIIIGENLWLTEPEALSKVAAVRRLALDAEPGAGFVGRDPAVGDNKHPVSVWCLYWPVTLSRFVSPPSTHSTMW